MTKSHQAELFSLWLLFPGAVSARLSRHTSQLNKITGGPEFEPHVTIASDLQWDEVRRFRDLALTGSLDHDSTLTFREVGYGNSYFQSVYFAVDLPDALHKLRLDAFRSRGIIPAFPSHVSLAYGVKPTDDIADITAGIEMDLSDVSTPIEAVAMVASSEDRPLDQWRILHQTTLSL